ncbi:MAG: cell division protein FtsK, partial [Desulfofustis sp.]|nr:cell division protein FtsK [Desulfofustis sp.]
MAQSEKKHSPGFRQEIVAVLGLFISAFVLISLISAQMSPASNWCGEVGRLVSQILLGFIGWGAYLLVGLLAWISFLFFNPRMSFERLPQVTLGISGAIISCCALLSSVSLRSPDLLESGGFLGKTVFTLIYSLLGSTGTVLILVLVLIVSLMLSTQFSPYQLIGLIWRSLRGLARGIFGVLGFAVQKVKNRPKKAPKVKKERSAPLVKTEIEPEKSEPVVQPVVKEFPKPEEPEDERKTFHAAPLAKGNWKLPPLSLLARNKQITEKVDKNVYLKISKQLEQKLKNFGVSGKVVGISPGPVVTTYEYSPAPGIKINKIVGLADDLALGLKAQSVRVIGSVPG